MNVLYGNHFKLIIDINHGKCIGVHIEEYITRDNGDNATHVPLTS